MSTAKWYTHAEFLAKYPVLTKFMDIENLDKEWAERDDEIGLAYPPCDQMYIDAERVLGTLTEAQVAILKDIENEADSVLAAKAGMDPAQVWTIHRACLNASGL